MIKQIAIYGGAFDPPHIGHLHLIKHLASIEGIDEVWLMPCGDRTDKKLLLSKDSRFRLMNKLFEDDHRIKISEQEINMSKAMGSSIHTYDLLAALKANYKSNKFYFVIGADILHSIHTWGNAEKLQKQNAFIIFHRKGVQFLSNNLLTDNKVIEEDLPQISSTYIKKVIYNHEKNRQQKLQQLKPWLSEQVLLFLIGENLI